MKSINDIKNNIILDKFKEYIKNLIKVELDLSDINIYNVYTDIINREYVYIGKDNNLSYYFLNINNNLNYKVFIICKGLLNNNISSILKFEKMIKKFKNEEITFRYPTLYYSYDKSIFLKKINRFYEKVN